MAQSPFPIAIQRIPVNIKQLQTSLKENWLTYYRDNRDWIVHLGVWVNDNGHRRPSSSFILATLAALEPQLNQLLPLIVDLNSSPDRIVLALGLNFSPDDEMEAIDAARPPKMLPSSKTRELKPDDYLPSRIAAKQDESCSGKQDDFLDEGWRV
ncbi:MAG: DUF5331 domain-containing protein [Synechococcales bacterium]|nr:DUF5331 domain-containing protein [Synechococcales bacterium]